MGLAVLACLCLLSLLRDHVTGLSTDPFVENGGTVVLPAPANASNVSITCNVSFQGTPVATHWYLTVNGTRTFILDMNDPNFQLSGGLLVPILTIVSFDQDLDMAVLECNNGFISNNEVAFFLLRIIEPPVLRSEPKPMIVVENDLFGFNISQSLGYPPDPSQNSEHATLTYQWFHDGVAINTTTSTNPNVSVYPEITFNPVMRTQSGKYSMIASTEGGDSTGFFILNVLAPPDGIRELSEMFGVVGMDTTITAFTSVTGNPTPNSTWMRDGVPLTSGRMYNTDNTGVLVISNVMLSDTGNYTNTLHNMFNNETFTNNFTISLQVLSPPGSPQSASVLNVTSNSVVLMWLNPVSVGVPAAFVRFSIELATTSKVLLMSANAMNNIDSSFTNTLTVTGLDPNTNYTISIRTVSTHPTVGDLVSDSIMQAITTLASALQFKQSILYNNDGILELEWTLRHTGGLPLHSISVTCSGGNSTTQLSYMCTPDMCGDDGSTRLGPVMAGSSYTCSVTASNAVGNTTSDTNIVITLTGIPSIPVISVSVGVQVRLQVTTAYAGVVAGDNSLHFNVSVYNTTSSGPKLLHQINLYPSHSEFLGASVLLNHNLSLQPGSYQFSAIVGNRYGSSPNSRLTTAVSLVQSSADSSVAIIVTVSVISVVIVVIAVSVLITVVICIMRRHTGSMTVNTVKSTSSSPTTQAPVALQHVQSVENESYGVLGGGVPKSIELKDNAAYSTVKPSSAPSQSIAVNSNVAYGITPATTDCTEPNYI